MALTGVAGKRNIEGYTLDLDAPDEIYSGFATLLRLRIVNHHRYLPAFLLHVELDGSTILIPQISAGASTEVVLPYRPYRRGHNRIEHIRVSSPFPVAFFVRHNTFLLDGDIIAFPAPRSLPNPASAADNQADQTGHATDRRGHQGEISGIADYTGIEPLKRIHWRLSARHDTLKIKELESDASDPVIVEPSRLTGNDLEERLSGAAWLIDRHLRNGRPVGLRLGPLTIAPATGRVHKLKLLRALALCDAD